MASNTFGSILQFSTWGESHGVAIGGVVDGVPPLIPLVEEDIQYYLDKRKPGQSRFTTQRKEPDKIKILSGEFENNELESLLRKYLNPMIDYGIDQLVLGCTHYFIVKDLIKKIVGNKITITNYNVAVAAQVKRILEEEKTINIEKNKIYNDFFTNGNKFAIELLIGNNKSVNKI